MTVSEDGSTSTAGPASAAGSASDDRCALIAPAAGRRADRVTGGGATTAMIGRASDDRCGQASADDRCEESAAAGRRADRVTGGGSASDAASVDPGEERVTAVPSPGAAWLLLAWAAAEAADAPHW